MKGEKVERPSAMTITNERQNVRTNNAEVKMRKMGE